MFIHAINSLIRVFAKSKKEPDKNVGWFKPLGNNQYGLFIWDGQWIQVGGSSSCLRTYQQVDSNDLLLSDSLYIHTITTADDINVTLPAEDTFRGEYIFRFSCLDKAKTLHFPEGVLVTGDKVTSNGVYEVRIMDNLAKIVRWNTNTRVRSFNPSFNFSFR